MAGDLHYDARSEKLTFDPVRLGVEVGHQPPLSVTPPGAGTMAPDLGAGPLRSVCEIERVSDLGAYWRAGWTEAVMEATLRPAAWVRPRRAALTLPPGFGLGVLDAWRPPRLQAALHAEAYSDPHLPPGYVTAPSDVPSEEPPHVSGGAVDVTLTWRGVPLRLGTGFDEFSPASHRLAFEDAPGVVRELRRLLDHTMLTAGWAPYDMEWWHFEFETRRWAEFSGREAATLSRVSA